METQTHQFPTLLVSTLMFIVVYLFGYLIVFRNWIAKPRSEAASCFISLAHGTPAVLFAAYSLMNSKSQLSFSSPNTNLQDMVLDYSIGYFFMDLSHYLVFVPTDVLFIAHHLATLYVLLTCRYVIHHGAIAILGLLIFAEITSPCQNTWSLARFRKADVPVAARFFEFLSPIFYVYYSVVRGIFAPVYTYKMGAFYASSAAEGMVPFWAWFSWMVIIVVALLVSIIWVWNHWIEFYHERTKRELRKSS